MKMIQTKWKPIDDRTITSSSNKHGGMELDFIQPIMNHMLQPFHVLD